MRELHPGNFGSVSGHYIPEDDAWEGFGRFVDDCLNETAFRSLTHARELIREWRDDYNGSRSHTSLGGLTPEEFAARSNQDHNQSAL